jgi:hypothetical protein
MRDDDERGVMKGGREKEIHTFTGTINEIRIEGK